MDAARATGVDVVVTAPDGVGMGAPPSAARAGEVTVASAHAASAAETAERKDRFGIGSVPP
jgi:hypothetical protein